MQKKYKISVLILIPIIFAALTGGYFGYEHYLKESQVGNDYSDSLRWAVIGGLFYSFIGMAVGLIFDLFVYMITTEPKHLKPIVGEDLRTDNN